MRECVGRNRTKVWIIDFFVRSLGAGRCGAYTLFSASGSLKSVNTILFICSNRVNRTSFLHFYRQNYPLYQLITAKPQPNQIGRVKILSNLAFKQHFEGQNQSQTYVLCCSLQIQLIRMSTWLKDEYEGQYKEGWYHGFGKLKMDNGIIYEGQFVKGHFHGEGKLIYPNGGYYKAHWEEGKMISGEYIFNDNLNFQKDNWKHCINEDRRFYQEYLHGIKPSGATQRTRQDKPHNIPTGTYDSGDGYYEPVKSIIYTYQGKILRTPTEEEVKFIVAKCRYVPKAVDIDGSKDKVIKKVLELQTKK